MLRCDIRIVTLRSLRNVKRKHAILSWAYRSLSKLCSGWHLVALIDRLELDIAHAKVNRLRVQVRYIKLLLVVQFVVHRASKRSKGTHFGKRAPHLPLR